ncbi:MAG TPA: HAD-IIA family hydrolase [Candidatus Limnocylindrales bacterium]|nr:HAD-IIA family hydrolase [Candidatus Limnocylindrales bacterium]
MTIPVRQAGVVDRRFGGYVFDLDGTLYLGERLIDGAAETVGRLRAGGARTLFLTNNPTHLPGDYAAKLAALGIPAERDDVVSSIDALVRYLREHASGARLLAITESLLQGVLTDAGFALTDDPQASDVVVVAWDRTFDYAKLTAAYRAVRHGARIVATNPDPYCPTPDGGLPDCAAMLAAIEACTGARAEAVVGKPSAHMAATVMDRLHLAPDDTILVGDRLLTDVRMARQAGMHAALVLSGATRREDVPPLDADHPDAPDYVLDDVTRLIAGPD